MNGLVTGHHAIIGVPFRLPSQPDMMIDFVVDTGFVGYLTLPPAAVRLMHLLLLRWIAANLADDSTIYVSVHRATVLWDGDERMVEVLATGARPLLGTLLLEAHQLTAQFTEGGRVAVEAL